MAKHVVIQFGPDDMTVLGDTMEEAHSKVLAEIEAKTGRPPTDAAKQSIYGTIKSQRENEKELIKSALQVYASKVKKELSTLVECGTLMRHIDKESGSAVTMTDHEINMFKKALPKMENIEHWALYVDLLAQLDNPQYKEDGEA